MENKVEIKVFLYCPCCNKNVDETSLWIDKEFAGRVGRLPCNVPCTDCWNREMGFFEAKEEKTKTKNQRILEEDEKDMHTGEGDDSVEEMEDEEIEEEEQEDEEEVE